MAKDNPPTVCGSDTTYIDETGSVRCLHCGFYMSKADFAWIRRTGSAEEIKILEDRGKAVLQNLQMSVCGVPVSRADNS